MRGSSEAGLGNRSGDARDLGGGIPSRKEAYAYLCRMLVRFACRKRRKVEEVLLRAYLRCTTRPSWALTARLPATYLANDHLYDLPTSRAHARVLGTMATQYASADRPPPQAAPGGPPGLGSRRIDGPRRPRREAWGLSRQRRRRGHPVPIHVPREAHLRELPATSPETSDGIVPPLLCKASTPTTGRSTTRWPRCWRSCAWRSSPRRACGAATTTAWRRARTAACSARCSVAGTSTGAHAERVDRFHCEIRAPYLNCHRPCLFAPVETDAKGSSASPTGRPTSEPRARRRKRCRRPSATCTRRASQPPAPSALRPIHGNHP